MVFPSSHNQSRGMSGSHLHPAVPARPLIQPHSAGSVLVLTLQHCPLHQATAFVYFFNVYFLGFLTSAHVTISRLMSLSPVSVSLLSVQGLVQTVPLSLHFLPRRHPRWFCLSKHIKNNTNKCLFLRGSRVEGGPRASEVGPH